MIDWLIDWLPEFRIFCMDFKVWATVAKWRASQLVPLMLLVFFPVFKFALTTFIPVMELLLLLLLLFALFVLLLLFVLFIVDDAGLLFEGDLPVKSEFISFVVFSLESSIFLHSLPFIVSCVLFFFFLWSLFLNFDEWGCGNSSDVTGSPP